MKNPTRMPFLHTMAFIIYTKYYKWPERLKNGAKFCIYLQFALVKQYNDEVSVLYIFISQYWLFYCSF